jgi:hypothetical protein
VTKVLLVHGVGDGFPAEVQEAFKAVLGDKYDLHFFDYAAVLDKVRWPRFLPVLFLPLARLLRADKRVDEVGDVKAWLYAPGVRTAITWQLRECLTEQSYDIVIAHSLGTLILWEALRKYDGVKGGSQPSFRPQVFLVGSPLALGSMRWFLRYRPDEELLADTKSSYVVAGTRDIITMNGRVDWRPKGWNSLVVRNGHDLLEYLPKLLPFFDD